MNQQGNGEETGGREEVWLASLARVYGSWHLGITALQSAAWATFVYWNEGGKLDRWADAVQLAGEKTWPAIPAFFITSIIILAAIQKGGGMVLTFVDKRRKKLAKERAEGRAEGRSEGRAEGRIEGRSEGRAELQVEWTEWNRRREEAERRGERFDEPPPSINGR